MIGRGLYVCTQNGLRYLHKDGAVRDGVSDNEQAFWPTLGDAKIALSFWNRLNRAPRPAEVIDQLQLELEQEREHRKSYGLQISAALRGEKHPLEREDDGRLQAVRKMALKLQEIDNNER